MSLMLLDSGSLWYRAYYGMPDTLLAPDGTPLPTREMGKSLYPSQDMEEAALALIQKYKPERPSARVHVPEPIARLERHVKGQLAARERMTNQMLGQLTNQAITDQLGPFANQMRRADQIEIFAIKGRGRELFDILRIVTKGCI